MAEIPDFDQIARGILDTGAPEHSPELWKDIDQRDYDASQETYPSGRRSTGRFAEPIHEALAREIAEQFRQIWNARGEADRDLLMRALVVVEAHAEKYPCGDLVAEIQQHLARLNSIREKVTHRLGEVLVQSHTPKHGIWGDDDAVLEAAKDRAAEKIEAIRQGNRR